MNLKRLVAPLTVREFKARHWPDSLLVQPGAPDRWSAFQRIGALSSPEAFLAAWKGDARAWPPLEKSMAAMEISPAQANAFYQAGFTLYFSKVEKVLPELLPTLRSLERDLNLRRGDMICEALLSKAGAGAFPHFDPNLTINLQLFGRKEWLWAPNECAEFPHVGGSVVERPHEELLPYQRKPFPKKMPKHSRRFETSTGSLVFLPHGGWHSTRCLEPSLALLFTVSAPSWTRLFTEELEKRLRAKELFRPFARIGNLNLRQRKAALLEIESRLASLRSLVESLNAESLLRAWSGPPLSLYRKTSSRKKPSKNDHLALRRWIEKQPGVFHGFDAVESLPNEPPEEVLRGLHVLQSEGTITPA